MRQPPEVTTTTHPQPERSSTSTIARLPFQPLEVVECHRPLVVTGAEIAGIY